VWLLKGGRLTAGMSTPSKAAAQVTPGAGFARRHLGKLIAIGLVVVVGGGLTLYTLFTLTFSYSSGERVGFVQKLSKRGWVCRTWEGELAMSPVPGAAPQIFAFSVPDEAVAQKVRTAEAKRVALVYEQKRGVPSSCFGETEYFVTDVRVVGQ
jgi:hypothetical protein